MAEGEWEPEAEDWLRWARTPGHDAYWYYRDGFFDAIVPKPGPRTLEVGCGEGRVARDLAGRGHGVSAIDTSHTLLRHARDADGGGGASYVLADGASLPFPDDHFDVVVAYNALQVVADMPGTVREIARVLTDGGRLCVCVVHPLSDLGEFASRDADAPFRMRASYFEQTRVEETVERDGITMTFRGWTYTLEDYMTALNQAGLRLESLREPEPADPPARYAQWRRVPMFLQFRAIKLGR